ncbi:unnamed protein product [Sympodiomycopsis kandeliae]
MTKLPTQHQLWVRASNSTRASILLRRNATASVTYRYHSHRHHNSSYSTTRGSPQQDSNTSAANSSNSTRISSTSSPEPNLASSSPSSSTRATSAKEDSDVYSYGEQTNTAWLSENVDHRAAATAAPSSSSTHSPASSSAVQVAGSPASSYRLTPVREDDCPMATTLPSNPTITPRPHAYPPAAVYYVPTPRVISSPIPQRHRLPTHSLHRTRLESGSAIASSYVPHHHPSQAAPFSTSASQTSPDIVSQQPNIPDVTLEPLLIYRLESQAHAAAHRLPIWRTTPQDESSNVVQLWNQDDSRRPSSSSSLSSRSPPPALTRAFDSLNLHETSSSATRPGIYDPPSSQSDRYRLPSSRRAATRQSGRIEHIESLPSWSSGPSIRLASGAENGGAGGHHHSAGGQGSNNAHDSGSGSSSWSSSSSSNGSSSSSSKPQQTTRNRSTAGTGSPPSTPSPGTSTILTNQNHNTKSNNTSSPTPFPFPSSRLSYKPVVIHPLDTYSTAPDAPRSLTFSHQVDVGKHDIPFYEFQHGAYGIPKRHPLAPSSGPEMRNRNTSNDAATSSPPPPPPKQRRSVLAAAADFLTGPVTPPPPPRQPKQDNQSQSDTQQSQNGGRRWKRLDPDHLRSVQVGEDAYFLRPDSLGIADGVGGWATRPGANPAMFSRLLMHFCSVELSRYDHLHEPTKGGTRLSEQQDQQQQQKYWDVDPVDVMQRAWERCVRVSRHEGILGSSTALLAMLRGNQLRIANLGDCVLLIVRQGQLLFRSQEQQHSFNFPVQLGMMIRKGTRDVEQLLEGWSVAAAKEKANESSSAKSNDETDYDTPESEATIRKHSRRLQRANEEMLGGNRELEAEEKKREEDGLRRRAEFEGRDMAEFEAELEASKEFDFDVNSGSTSGNSHHHTHPYSANSNAAGDVNDVNGDVSGSGFGVGMGLDPSSHETTEDGKTIYVGVDDDHPWDEPQRDCGRWTIRVEKGDIIIVASDGLVDNLFDDDILEEVQRFAPAPATPSHHDNEAETWSHEHESHYSDSLPHDLRRDSGIDLAAMANGFGPEPPSYPSQLSSCYPPSTFSPQLLSEALCSRAKAISQDSKAIISPFQQKATEEGLHYVGGKHDDISVLVAVVGEHQNRSDGEEGKEELRFQNGARAAS